MLTWRSDLGIDPSRDRGLGLGNGGKLMQRIGLYLGALLFLMLPTGKASAQFNVANMFSNIGKSAASMFSGTGQSTGNQMTGPQYSVATPQGSTTSNRKVGGFQFMNTTNASQNPASVFNANTSGTQLLGNRVTGYSNFPTEGQTAGMGYLQSYFHFRTYKPGGKN